MADAIVCFCSCSVEEESIRVVDGVTSYRCNGCDCVCQYRIPAPDRTKNCDCECNCQTDPDSWVCALCQPPSFVVEEGDDDGDYGYTGASDDEDYVPDHGQFNVPFLTHIHTQSPNTH